MGAKHRGGAAPLWREGGQRQPRPQVRQRHQEAEGTPYRREDRRICGETEDIDEIKIIAQTWSFLLKIYYYFFF